MSGLIHLQHSLNKVVDDVVTTTLDNFVEYMSKEIDESAIQKAQLYTLLAEYKKTLQLTVFNFGPKKKEKKSRPPNSYNMFIREKMREIKLAHPEYKGKELMKRATEEWNKQKAVHALQAQAS
jgi:hypothetical protein